MLKKLCFLFTLLACFFSLVSRASAQDRDKMQFLKNGFAVLKTEPILPFDNCTARIRYGMLREILSTEPWEREVLHISKEDLDAVALKTLTNLVLFDVLVIRETEILNGEKLKLPLICGASSDRLLLRTTIKTELEVLLEIEGIFDSDYGQAVAKLVENTRDADLGNYATPFLSRYGFYGFVLREEMFQYAYEHGQELVVGCFSPDEAKRDTSRTVLLRFLTRYGIPPNYIPGLAEAYVGAILNGRCPEAPIAKNTATKK